MAKTQTFIAETGNIHAGPYYPMIVAGITFVIVTIFLKETHGQKKLGCDGLGISREARQDRKGKPKAEQTKRIIYIDSSIASFAEFT